MSYKAFIVEYLDEGKIVKVTINRPKSLNAMNSDFFTQIQTIFKKINSEENSRVAILVSQGKVFTAGLDLKQFGSLFTPDTDDSARSSIKLYEKVKLIQSYFLSLVECRVPVLVGIHNMCIGGGIDLSCMTDIRYCTKDAQFTIKEIDIGMAADLGTLQVMPKIVGNQSTFRQLAYTGRLMTAQQAQKIGFVSKIFQNKQSMNQGLMETARLIASKSPVGIYTLKQVFKKQLEVRLKQGLDHIALLNSSMLRTQDTMEAVSSFLQKRKPVFAKL